MYTNIAEKLSSQGIRPSIQRLEVYNYLCTYKNHPTVEIIYTALVPSIPTLSKTTVYNTLKLFIEHNLVQTITIEEDELRFDADTSFHYHFKCVNCGKIFDIAGEKPNLPQLPEHFVCLKSEISLRGLCAECSGRS